MAPVVSAVLSAQDVADTVALRFGLSAPTSAGQPFSIVQTAHVGSASIDLPMLRSASTDLGHVVFYDEDAVRTFLADHHYYGEARKILSALRRHIEDISKLELALVEGDFEGETYLEIMVHSGMEPKSFIAALDRVHRETEDAMPLERLILTSINFRLH
jgi:hypothetical protein